LKNYVKTAIQPMEPWTEQSNMQSVSISSADRLLGSPKLGDMLAHSPANPEDRWLVEATFFYKNYREA
jgi:hypothetical protein